MKNEHTPGPWIYRRHTRHGMIIETADGEPIAAVYKAETDEADADLMARAPQLKKALELFVRFFGEMPKDQLGRIVCDIGVLNDALIESGKALARKV